MTSFRTVAKNFFAFAALGLALSAASTSARAQDADSGTPDQRRLCTPEAIKYCMNSPDGIPGIAKCLRTDSRVSLACKRAMARN